MLLSTEYIPHTPPSFHERLKIQTSDAHIKLEQIPLSQCVTSELLTISQYSDYLNAMLSVHLQVETEIFPRLKRQFTDIDKRQKSQLIIKDLSTINVPAHAAGRPFGDLSHTTDAFLTGIMYVVEGSTLGGRYILRNIKSTLQLDENTGATYFNGYGADTSANWKQFIAELNAFEQRNDCGSEIIEGANFAFEAIECHMTEYNQL